MGFFVPGHFMPARSCLLIAAAVCPSVSTSSGNTQISSWRPWSWAVSTLLGKEKLNQGFPNRFPLPSSELYPGVSAISELEWRLLEV